MFGPKSDCSCTYEGVKEHEKEKWSAINYHFMTDESDEEDVVFQHKLVWRSEGILYVIFKFLHCMSTNTSYKVQ